MEFLGSSFFIEGSGGGSVILPYADGVVAALSSSQETLDLIRSVAQNQLQNGAFCIHKALSAIAENKASWQGDTLHILHINSASSELDIFVLNAPLPLYRARTNHTESFGNVQSNLNPTSTLVDTISLSNLSTMFISLDHRVTTIVENHLPFLFSKREVLKVISEFTDDQEASASSFLFINNEITRNRSISKRDTIKASLSEIIAYEESLDQFISEQFPEDVVASTNSMLIFNELLINALEHGALGITRDEKQKAMHNGSYESLITQREKERDGNIHIEVDLYNNHVARFTIKDSGDGFDFEKYTDILPTAERFHGRGVIMSKQGSLAMFYSERGTAVTFFMRFASEKAPAEDIIDSEALLKEFTILYAEDDDFVRTRLALILKRMAKDVLLARDGKEALELFTKYRPQIVISDVEMPHLNGLDLAREIRKLTKDAPILITTAYYTDDFFNEAYLVGVDKFLSKPVSIAILKNVLYDFARTVYAKELMLKELHKNI